MLIRIWNSTPVLDVYSANFWIIGNSCWKPFPRFGRPVHHASWSKPMSLSECCQFDSSFPMVPRPNLPVG